jgi:hypothetical protein
VVGWRDAHFPGPVLYVQPVGGEQSMLWQAAATLDRRAVGFVQEMFEDNEFFASVAEHLKNKGFRATFGLLSLPDDYELLKGQAPSDKRLPMSEGQPDVAFADEEDGVVAVKLGEEIFYASLYWRSRTGINSLARVHWLTPRYQQVAVAYEQAVYEPSGKTWKRPDWTNFGFANGGFKYRGFHSALAGEELPIPKLPDDVTLGKMDNPYGGRADFYQLKFGPYFIAMNGTERKTFEVTPPAGAKEGKDLISGKVMSFEKPIKLGPLSTVVFRVDE